MIAEWFIGAIVHRAPWMSARLVAQRHMSPLMQVLKMLHGIAVVELDLPARSRLAIAGSRLRLRVDSVILPAILDEGAWQYEEVQRISRLIDSSRRYLLVDVGANAGLIARQALLNISSIVAARCYEPDPTNYSCLKHNLDFHPNAICRNIALGNRKGEMEFFLDNTNSGNFSLVQSAMASHSFTKEVVDVEDANQVFNELELHLDPDWRLIYKSDTQGLDELIVSSIDSSFWSRVDVVLIEIYRIKKPEFDLERFRSFLEGFRNRSLEGIGEGLSVDEIMAFVDASPDNSFCDLVLWR